MGYFRAGARSAGARLPGCRRRGRGLDSRLEPVRRRARRRAGPAVRVRLALRARAADGGDRVYRRASARRPASGAPTSCSVSTSSRADTDDEARLLLSSLQQAFVNLRSGRPPVSRRPSPATTSASPRTAPRCSTASSPARHRLARRSRRLEDVRRAHRRRRADPRLDDLRPRRPAALVRDRRWALGLAHRRRNGVTFDRRSAPAAALLLAYIPMGMRARRALRPPRLVGLGVDAISTAVHERRSRPRGLEVPRGARLGSTIRMSHLAWKRRYFRGERGYPGVVSGNRYRTLVGAGRAEDFWRHETAGRGADAHRPSSGSRLFGSRWP